MAATKASQCTVLNINKWVTGFWSGSMVQWFGGSAVVPIWVVAACIFKRANISMPIWFPANSRGHALNRLDNVKRHHYSTGCWQATFKTQPIALVIWNEWCDKAVNKQKGENWNVEQGLDCMIPGTQCLDRKYDQSL